MVSDSDSAKLRNLSNVKKPHILAFLVSLLLIQRGTQCKLASRLATAGNF